MKRLEEYISVRKLVNPGIYIFINKTTNKFYVGQSASDVYTRISNHLMGSHNKTIHNLVSNEHTELHVYTIDELYDNNIFYNEDLNFIEYYTMKYLVNKGYESINCKHSFANKIKEKYNSYEKVDLDQLIKLEKNLFASNLKEFFLYRRKLKNLNTTQSRLEYQQNKNMELENKIRELKNSVYKQKKCYIQTVYKDYFSMKCEISNLKQENSYLKDKLNITERTLEKLKKTKDIQIKSVEDELYKEINEKNIELKNLECEVLFLKKNSNSRTNHNIILKKVLKKIMFKQYEYINLILAFIEKETHYRGTKEDYNKYKANNEELYKLKMFLEDIIDDKNLLFELNYFNSDEVIYRSIAYCCNMHLYIHRISDLLEAHRIKEKGSNNEIKEIAIIEKNFINKYNKIIKKIEVFKKDLEDKLCNL